MKIIRIAFLFTLGLFLVQCGGEDKKEEKQEVKIKKKADEPAEDDGTVTVLITGNDQMRFNLEEIKVPAGATVKLTLKHVGKLDAKVMGHNWVLLTQGTEIPVFAQAAAAANENAYIPEGTDNVLAHTKMLGGGQSDTITFEAPTAPGEYDFICSFPGHSALMKGKFIVV
ncbi:azurin [Croceiramulus getboli]|nr:azurin [Flavobacteriaceae bacterium YJPT1-3]